MTNTLLNNKAQNRDYINYHITIDISFLLTLVKETKKK